MKKVLSVLMVVAAMMFATNANAQIKFGLKGGLDVTNMSLSNDVFDASNKTGFFVGPMVKVTIPIVALILLLILLHIPLSVIPIHIVIVSFSCILRTRRSSRFADITFFRLRRFGRFWFFIVCFTDNRHSLVISCTKISFFDIIFLQ